MTREEMASACLSHSLTKASESQDPYDIHTWLVNAREASQVIVNLNKIQEQEARRVYRTR